MRRAGHGIDHQFARTVAVGASMALVPLLVMASSALAAWSPIVTLTASGWEGTASAVAVNRHGDALLAWSAETATGNPYPDHRVQVRTRTRYGVLGPIETLSTSGNWGYWVAAAIDDDGHGVVAWVTAAGPVDARQISPAGKLGPTLTLTPPGVIADSVTVVMSPTGQALAVWAGQSGSGGSVGAQARYVAANGALGRVLALGDGPFGERPSVVIGRNGVATVAWADENGQRVVARRLRPGRVSGLKVIMPTAANTGYVVPPITDDSRGDTVFAVTRVVHLASSQPTYLAVRVWRAGGTLSSAERIAKNADDVDSTVAVATDRTGDSIVAWSRYVTATRSDVFGRRVSRTGRLGSVVTLGVGFAPTLTIDPAGTGLATWQSTPLPLPSSTGYGQTQLHERRFAAATGTFGPKITLTSNGRMVGLGESWTGKIAAFWQQSTQPWPIRARFGP